MSIPKKFITRELKKSGTAIMYSEAKEMYVKVLLKFEEWIET